MLDLFTDPNSVSDDLVTDNLRVFDVSPSTGRGMKVYDADRHEDETGTSAYVGRDWKL